MSKIIKSFFKYSLLLSYGGMAYMIIELLFRGRTHYTMSFCGGICFVCIGLLNELRKKLSLVQQCIISGLFIVTPIEYLFGILFNSTYEIWDYRNLPLNINGHICIPFSVLWCFVSLIAILADDYLRYYIFNEERPSYKLF